MRRLVAVVVLTGLLAMTGGAVIADEPNDDPNASGTTGLFVIPRASVMEPGAWSLGLSYALWAREEGTSNVENGAISGGFTFGAAERLELFASFEPRVGVRRDFLVEQAVGLPKSVAPRLNDHPFAGGDWQDGVGDLRLGAKYKFVGDVPAYHGIAFAASLKIPTADDEAGIGTGQFDVGFDLIGSYEFAEMLGLNSFLGVLLKSDPDEFEVSNELRYGVGLQVPTRSVLQGILELHGIHYLDDDPQGPRIPTADFFYVRELDNPVFLQGGLRLSLDNGLAISAGVNKNLALEVPEAVGDIDEETLGSFWMVSYSTSRPIKLMYQGTGLRELPPVNRPPTIECRAERTTLRQGESVRLFAEVSDPDGDDVTVTWSVQEGTLSSETGTEVTWDSTGVPPGSGPVVATAEDGYGGSDTCELRLTVEAPPPPPEPTMLDFSCTEFSSGSTRIDNRCKAVLDDVALQLRENSRATAVITGHTDSTGSDAQNDKIAQQRADNAKTYLVETHGIDADRIETASAGAGDPIADNSTRAGRAQNRRIEVVVTIPPE